jgi:glycyl-tRNA synthetase beta chain
LYDEVTALTEWPVAMTGQFDAAFLALPREVITATLSGHQRYFPVEDKQGNLLPVFAVVANLESKEPGKVRAGNERVVAPRLADAAFFWETDRQTPLSERQEGLQNVVYQKGLGSIADKSVRISRLAMVVCSQLGVESDDAERAATLSKCDLQTGMVGEFPELQGTIGSYYAQEDGEPIEVCLAIGEQYLPRFAGDELPEGAAGQAVAIADRLDTIAGILALGRKPTGNSDPFGLRRAALGVVRIIIERGLELDLPALIAVALNQQPVKGAEAPALADEMYEFIIDRMRSWYLDRRSVTPQMFEAVRVRRPPSLADFDQRLVAVSAFVRLDAADSLAAANKRIANILRKAETKGKLRLDPKKLSEDAESALHDAMLSASDSIAPLMRKRAYADALTQLAKLRDPVDKFFDDVMVMTDDKALRQNRLALLSDLRDLFLDIADISRLSISKD